jgi:hypothetical protein
MSFVQLDMEVIFDYPDVSMDRVVTDEADSMNDQFNCSQGGSAHQGVFGPFGLLVLTDFYFFSKIPRNFSSLMSLSAIVQIPAGFDTTKIDLVEIGVYTAYSVEKCLQSKNNN